MTTPIGELIRRCQAHRGAGAKEKKLREEFVSHLRRVFADATDQTWIDHYIEGAETTQHRPARGKGRAKIRFVDTLVRATILEYEPDVDMCCGSGAIVAECLKSIIERRPDASIERLAKCITGFDIDPVAVSFAKTTWVLTLRDRIKRARHSVAIPIFHADSLFVASPTARQLPVDESTGEVQVELDGETICLPAALIQPQFRPVFDDVVDWAYDNAVLAVETGEAAHVTVSLASQRLDAALETHSVALEGDILIAARNGLFRLASRMAVLAIAKRNGVWAFILKNTYRPSLLAAQFNGVVSNPPWLALSKIGNNPYKSRIAGRTSSYRLDPSGSSFLHLEIATTFLLYAIDRYLTQAGQIAVLLPGTVVNGAHHQPFRSAMYHTSRRPVTFQIAELWEIDRETFKAPCVGLIGRKTSTAIVAAATTTAGYITTAAGRRRVEFSVHTLSSQRTAWNIGATASTASTNAASAHLAPMQGADLMPRTAVCVTILDDTGSEWRVDTPTTTGTLSHVVADSKKMKQARFPGFVAPRFLHGMLQSKGLVPFAFDTRLPPIAVPAERNTDRSLTLISDEEIRARGFRKTASRFHRIERAYHEERIGKSFRGYLDVRGKLRKQIFPAQGYLVLTPPGGSNVTAAVFELSPRNSQVLVDQTLYWYWLEFRQAADFYVGMFNSDPLAAQIEVFVPEGVFGRRHLHTLPWRVTPVFDPNDEDHVAIAELSANLQQQVAAFIRISPEFAEPRRWLKAGRKLIREMLQSNADMKGLNQKVEQILARTAG